jgi:enoyl-CoA hydratase
MTDELVRYTRDDALGIITLCRKPLNTYDGAFHIAFQRAWRTAKSDDSRVVVMLAEGDHFCVGAELKNPQPAPAGAEVLAPADEIRLIKGVMKPTIAAVQGGCIGGGQRMVWPCDVVLCAENAFFRDPTAQMGIGGIQSHLHTWFYGPRLAKEMIYTGMRLPAARLHAMGQVNRILPDRAELHKAALELGREIARQDPLPLRQAKRAADITMDIQGQHYVTSRMEELLDEAPRFHFR